MLRRFLLGTLVLYVALFQPTGISGQSTFGSITGTVTDPSGALIPRAAVAVTSESRGTVRHVTTGPSGVFNVPDLEVGAYRVSVAVAGFATYEQAGVNLNANQVISLNVQLVLASKATVTEVTAAAPIINTSDATISSVVTGQSMEQVALVSRHHADAGFYDLMLLNPGTAQVPDNGAGATINGVNQATGQTVAIDGITLMRNTSGYGAGEEQPSFDAVRELNVITTDAPAEFASPVATTEVTVSGTNKFHGAGFESYNSNILDTRDFFNPGNIPRVVYNDFGANLGGPIQKNKTFFYFSFEGSRTGSDQLLVASVPTAQWRNGNLSSLCSTYDASGNCTDPGGTQLFYPNAGSPTPTPIPYNTMPSGQINGVSKNIINLYPSANYGPPDLVSNNYRMNFPGVGTTVWDVYNGRLDHNFGSHDAVFGRFDTRRVPQVYTNDVPSIGHEFQVRNGFSSVFSWTHTFTPALLNEFRAGYVRGRNLYYPYTVGSDVIKQLGIQGVTTSGVHNVPIFDVNGLTDIDMDEQDDQYEDHLEQNFTYIDNLTWTRGRHLMKFGFSATHDQIYGAKMSSNMYGQFIFTGAYTGLGYADLLFGIPQTSTLSVPTPYNYGRGNIFGVYAQDQFKVNRRLTLDYGVRWDIEPPFQDKNGEIYSFNPKNGDLVLPDNALSKVNPFYPTNIPLQTATQAGYPDGSLMDFHKDWIRPRIGFAFTPAPNGKTVIRAGYGIYSNQIYADLPHHMNGGPFSGTATYENNIVNGAPLFSFPYAFLPSSSSAVPPTTEDVQGTNPHFKPPYSQQWNVTVERQFGTVAVKASYVGALSLDQFYQRDLNQPHPSLTPYSDLERPYQSYFNVIWLDDGATQSFNALEVSVTKTYGKNLTFNSGWTWAKDLTDAGDSTSVRGNLIQNAFDLKAERGNNYDTPTHRVFGYALYALPFGQGQRFLGKPSALVQGLLGGWHTSWNMVIQSGEFFTPTFSGVDTANVSIFGERPDRIGNGKLSRATGQTINNWFNLNAFKIPGCPDSQPQCSDPANVGRFGDSGFDILRGPSLFNFDFALMKDFPIKENLKLQFRVNMVNALNHPNFYQPDANITDGPYPQGTAGVLGGTTSANGLGEPTTREIDFWLKLVF